MTADLHPIAGDGVLARYGELLVLTSAPPDGHELVNQVLAAHLHLANTNPDGWALADAVAAVLGTSPVPLDVVTVGPTHGAQAVSVFGTAEVTIGTSEGELRIALAHNRQGARAVLPGQLTSLRALTGPDRQAPGGELPWTDHGVIQATGVLFGAAFEPQPEPQPQPEAQPQQPEPFTEPPVEATTAPEPELPPPPPPPVEAVPDPWGSPQHAAPEYRQPEQPAQPAQPQGVQVLGVYCPSGHFGDPAAPYCATCGAPMPPQPSMLYPGVRPPLGVLVLEDGSVHVLDKDYVIGRDPDRDPDVASGAAHGLRIDDPDSALSRVHARIHLDNWTVTAIDLDSANGTGIWQPGEAQWAQLPAHQPVPLRSGAQLGLGRSQLRYESRPIN